MRRRSLPSLLVAAFLVVVPASARADEVDRLFDEGAACYARDDLEGARRAFAASYRLMPRARTAANLGQIELLLGRYADAATHLRRALDSVERKILSEEDDALLYEQRDAIAARLAEALPRVATLTVSCEKPATITVDGVATHCSRPQPIYVDPGRHVLTLHEPGYRPARRAGFYAAGTTSAIGFELVELPPTVRAPSPEQGILVPAWPGFAACAVGLVGIGAGAGLYLSPESGAQDEGTGLMAGGLALSISSAIYLIIVGAVVVGEAPAVRLGEAGELGFAF